MGRWKGKQGRSKETKNREEGRSERIRDKEEGKKLHHQP
jgi:hypothetical protein